MRALFCHCYRSAAETNQVLRHARGSLACWVRDLAILANRFIATVARLLLRWRAIDPLRVAPAEASAVDCEYVPELDMFVRNEKVCRGVAARHFGYDPHIRCRAYALRTDGSHDIGLPHG